MPWRPWFAIAAAVATVACSPALDWRSVRPDGSRLVAMFPCKPASHARDVALAGITVRMTMHACRAGDVLYAVTFADLADPARVTPALVELRRAAAGNLGTADAPGDPARVTGMTPNDEARRVSLAGRRPDGSAIREQLAVFAFGTRVYQATVLGERIDDDAARQFFDGLRIAT